MGVEMVEAVFDFDRCMPMSKASGRLVAHFSSRREGRTVGIGPKAVSSMTSSRRRGRSATIWPFGHDSSDGRAAAGPTFFAAAARASSPRIMPRMKPLGSPGVEDSHRGGRASRRGR